MESTREEEFLLYLDFFSRQEDIDASLQNFSQIRNYFGGGVTERKMYSAVIALANVLAGAPNATLIGEGHPMFKPGLSPIVMPYLTMFDSNDYGIGFYWNHYRNNT